MERKVRNKRLKVRVKPEFNGVGWDSRFFTQWQPATHARAFLVDGNVVGVHLLIISFLNFILNFLSIFLKFITLLPPFFPSSERSSRGAPLVLTLSRPGGGLLEPAPNLKIRNFETDKAMSKFGDFS